MKYFLFFVTLILQVIGTFVLLIGIYMILALLDYQGGIEGFIGTTIIQPIFGGVISILTIFICFIPGIPIRFVKLINTWWIRNYYVSILGSIIGILLIVASFLPSQTEMVKTTIENNEVIKELPNLTLIVLGWFSVGFFTLHIYPPERIMVWLEYHILSITKLNANNDRKPTKG